MIVSCRHDNNVVLVTGIDRHQLLITGLTKCWHCVGGLVRDIDNNTGKTESGSGI